MLEMFHKTIEFRSDIPSAVPYASEVNVDLLRGKIVGFVCGIV
jgi:hypothetical protein